MKIGREKAVPTFRPVTITVETHDDLEDLVSALRRCPRENKVGKFLLESLLQLSDEQ